MAVDVRRNNKNNGVKKEDYILGEYGIGKTITEEGEYLARIVKIKKDVPNHYVIVSPYDFEDGQKVTYEDVRIYLNSNNAEDSAAGQFLKLFHKAKTNKEIVDQPIKVYIGLNETDGGKCYKNILEITKVDKAKLEEYRKSTMRNEADELSEESALNAEE